jgi:predicted acetyltransferase
LQKKADELEVTAASPADRLPLYRMLELYQHDLSDIWDQDLDVHGEYGYSLDRYWRGIAWPYVFRVGGRLAGFALVDRRVRIEGDDFWMDQFFVLKGFRRRGVGGAAAIDVFDRHPGRWQVGQMPGNANARAFWRRVIGAYASDAWTEETIDLGYWQGTVQRFTVPGRAAA